MLKQPAVELEPPRSAAVVLGTVAGFAAVETVSREAEALELGVAAVIAAVLAVEPAVASRAGPVAASSWSSSRYLPPVAAVVVSAW